MKMIRGMISSGCITAAVGVASVAFTSIGTGARGSLPTATDLSSQGMAAPIQVPIRQGSPSPLAGGFPAQATPQGQWLAALRQASPALVVPRASTAGTAPTSTGDLPPQSVAVVSPLLKVLLWGDSVGLNVGCSIASSYMASTAGDLNLPAGDLPDITTGTCTDLSDQGADGLTQLYTALLPVAAINPYVNPAIEALAQVLYKLGTEYGESLAPFGPTIAGMGGTVAFFEGS